MTAPQYACKSLLVDCNDPIYDWKPPQHACNISLPICNIPLSDLTIPLHDSKPSIASAYASFFNVFFLIPFQDECSNSRTTHARFKFRKNKMQNSNKHPANILDLN